MVAYYDAAEGLDAQSIKRLQAIRLAACVERAARSPFYAKRLAEAGVSPESIRTVDDIRRIPFTTKADLRANYPSGLLTVPERKVIRVHVSSGTTGTPTVVYYSRNDVLSWAQLMARCMFGVGMRETDVFQNMTGYGLFTGGLGMHYGAELLGCLTIPAGPGSTKRQLKLLRDFKVTCAHIIPSYALHLADVAIREGVDPESLSLGIALIGAEPHTEVARRRIQDLLRLKAFNSYGLTEMNGPGVAFECERQSGMHLWEDAFVGEIVDPETGEPLPDGEVGELVLTSLCREAMPILRYRTRDLTRFIPGECDCGRKHRRIDRIQGRSDDMFIIKGVNIFPQQIESVLLSQPEVGQNYLIELEREAHVDQVRVKVELKPEYFVEDMRALSAIQKRLVHALREEILITPRVDLVEHNSLPKSEGKAVRVADLRAKDE